MNRPKNKNLDLFEFIRPISMANLGNLLQMSAYLPIRYTSTHWVFCLPIILLLQACAPLQSHRLLRPHHQCIPIVAYFSDSRPFFRVIQRYRRRQIFHNKVLKFGKPRFFMYLCSKLLSSQVIYFLFQVFIYPTLVFLFNIILLLFPGLTGVLNFFFL